MKVEMFTDCCIGSVVAACEPLHPLLDELVLWLYKCSPRKAACGRIAITHLPAVEGRTVAMEIRLQVLNGGGRWKGCGKITVTPADLSPLAEVRQWVAALRGDPDALALLEAVKAEEVVS